jgi:hypothetical protein
MSMERRESGKDGEYANGQGRLAALKLRVARVSKIYWGLAFAKFAAITLAVWGAFRLVEAVFGTPKPVLKVALRPFGTDLGYTTALLVLWLAAVGLVVLAVRDQRLRCRTCARRLRMPVSSGAWNHILMGRPHTDYICAYGHGTLRIPEVGIDGPEQGAWEPIDDMWRELEELHTSGR